MPILDQYFTILPILDQLRVSKYCKEKGYIWFRLQKFKNSLIHPFTINKEDLVQNTLAMNSGIKLLT